MGVCAAVIFNTCSVLQVYVMDPLFSLCIFFIKRFHTLLVLVVCVVYTCQFLFDPETNNYSCDGQRSAEVYIWNGERRQQCRSAG